MRITIEWNAILTVKTKYFCRTEKLKRERKSKETTIFKTNVKCEKTLSQQECYASELCWVCECMFVAQTSEVVVILHNAGIFIAYGISRPNLTEYHQIVVYKLRCEWRNAREIFHRNHTEHTHTLRESERERERETERNPFNTNAFEATLMLWYHENKHS